MDTSTPQTWRIVDVLKWSKDFLFNKGIESPQIEVEWMLRDVLNCSRIDIYLNHERPLSAGELSTFKKILVERVTGKPLQYILGYTEFMGYKIRVNRHVLIPRPETEIIVEKVLYILTKDRNSNPQVLDVGTGSGCIAISIAAACQKCSVLALDISHEALDLAKQNAELNKVSDRIRFVKKDILNDFPDTGLFNIIVSNPPYVDGEYWDNLPDTVKKYEPEIALRPNGDSLIFYRRLSQLATRHLTADGVLAVEIGGTYQEKDVIFVLRENGLGNFEVIKDYLGQSRGILARLNK